MPFCNRQTLNLPSYPCTPPNSNPHPAHLQPRVQLYLVDCRLDRCCLRQLLQVRNAKVADADGADHALQGGGSGGTRTVSVGGCWRCRSVPSSSSGRRATRPLPPPPQQVGGKSQREQYELQLIVCSPRHWQADTRARFLLSAVPLFPFPSPQPSPHLFHGIFQRTPGLRPCPRVAWSVQQEQI